MRVGGKGQGGHVPSSRRQKGGRIFTCFRDFKTSPEAPMVQSNLKGGCSCATAPPTDPPLSAANCLCSVVGSSHHHEASSCSWAVKFIYSRETCSVLLCCGYRQNRQWEDTKMREPQSFDSGLRLGSGDKHSRELPLLGCRTW